MNTPNLDLNETYTRFLKSLKKAPGGLNLINSGDTSINGKKFKWLIETHKNGQIQMHEYDFVTYQNGKTYIIIFSTFSNRFELLKPTFDTISKSFSLTE